MRCVAVLMLCGVGPVALAQVEPDAIEEGRRETLRKGVQLHQSGNYDAALKVYETLLKENPDDALALYETSLTYTAMKDYGKCIDAAQRASAVAAKQIQAQVLGSLASCQDLAGRVPDALATFERGVALFPWDASLNFNYAITLLRQGDPGKARGRLRAAIENQPKYGSPYRVYAGLLQQEGNSAAALFMNLRLILAEGPSPKNLPVAQEIVRATTAKRDEAGDLTIKVALSPATLEAEGREFHALGVAIPVSMAEAMRQNLPTRAAYVVTVIDAVFTAAGKLPASTMQERFVWRHAAQPVMRLKEQGVLTPFLYHIANLARVEGAEQWLRDNPAEVEKLVAVLKAPSAPN